MRWAWAARAGVASLVFAADTAQSETAVIPFLLVSIFLKRGGSWVPERYCQVPGAVSEMAGVHTAVHPGI